MNRTRTCHSVVLAASIAALALGCRDESPHEHHAAPEAEPADHNVGHAHEHAEGEGEPVADNFEGPGRLDLPDDLRALIVEEMVQIESAMHRILSLLVRGELSTVEKTARKVHDSFVLAQKLTEDQAATLHERLPPEFVSLDRQFHQAAADLAAAAKAGDAARASELFARMNQSCVGCHRAYARERFPGLAGDGGHAREPSD